MRPVDFHTVKAHLLRIPSVLRERGDHIIDVLL
jgi:hypothetical protein